MVYSFGHRNPQGLAYGNDKIYASEHGDATEDELNIILPKTNYGWPTVQGSCNTSTEITFCNTNKVKEPIWSSGASTEAIAGLDYYPKTGKVPILQNSLLLVSLKFTTSNGLGRDLRVYKMSQDGSSILSQTILFNTVFGRMRDLCVSPDGDIYIATSNQDGRGTPTADDDRIVKLKYNKVTALDNEFENSQISISPNPGTDIVTIAGYAADRIYFSSVTGQVAQELIVLEEKTNISGLKAGVYIVQNEIGQVIGKFVKN